MPPPYCYEFPRPSVTVDLAAFARSGESIRVLLIRRKHDPFAGRWALPGGFLDIDEPVEAAARRELREETGLDVTGPVAFVGVFGDPGRDPRGRTISLVHAAVIPGPTPEAAGGDDADEAAWLDPFAVSGLAFDHDAILKTARDWLARALDSGPAALAWLPEEFDADEVRRLFQAVRVPEDRQAVWVERMTRAGAIEPLPGQPARYRSKPAGGPG